MASEIAELPNCGTAELSTPQKTEEQNAENAKVSRRTRRAERRPILVRSRSAPNGRCLGRRTSSTIGGFCRGGGRDFAGVQTDCRRSEERNQRDRRCRVATAAAGEESGCHRCTREGRSCEGRS